MSRTRMRNVSFLEKEVTIAIGQFRGLESIAGVNLVLKTLDFISTNRSRFNV